MKFELPPEINELPDEYVDIFIEDIESTIRERAVNFARIVKKGVKA